MNQRIIDTKISGIRKFYNKVNKVEGAISLTLGQPDFNVPKCVAEAMKEAIDKGYTGYTSNEGIKELRSEISSYLSKKQVHYDEDEICITVGGSEGLFDVFMTIIEENDKVLIPEIGYPAYKSIVEMLGGVCVTYKINEDFSINIDDIKNKLQDDEIKAFVISYPCNPTGAVLSKEDRDNLVKCLHSFKGLIITDEMYEALCYDDEYYSILQVPELKDKTVYIGGFSKMLSMTGLRIGYVCGTKEFLSLMIKAHQYNVSSAPSISQYGALAGLRYGQDDVLYMKNEFKKRRDFVYEELKKMNLDVNKPKGAFYIFPSIKEFNMTSDEFCTRFLNEKKVACVPGSAFGDGGEGYIRISYCYSMEQLEKCLKLLKEFVEELRSK